MAKELHRSKDRMIGGVVGGIADYLDIDHSIARIGYAVLTILTSLAPGIIIYIICLVIVKDAEEKS